MQTNLNVYSKFDNELLNHFRKQGGCTISVLKQLVRLMNQKEVIYGFFGFIQWDFFYSNLSQRDKDIIYLIQKEWNWIFPFTYQLNTKKITVI